MNITTLMSGIVARLSREQSRELTRLGVSLPGARLLCLLLECEILRCSTLAGVLGIDAPTLSHVLRALATRDLITRGRARDDNRSVEVRLTPEGRVVASQCRDIERITERDLLEGLDVADVARLASILGRLDHNLSSPRERSIDIAREAARVLENAEG